MEQLHYKTTDMNNILLIFAFLILTFSLSAQISKGKKALEKGDFETAVTSFENDLSKPTNRIISLQELSKIYANKKFKDYSLEKAYSHISRAITEYEKLSSGDRKKLQSQDISGLGMSKQQNDLVIAAIQSVEQANQLDAAQKFLDFYTTATARQVENMTRLRDNLAFEKAVQENKFSAIDAFYTKHQKTCEQYNKDLLVKAQRKLLEFFVIEKGWAGYPTFEEKYPDNLYVKDQKAAYAFIQIVRKNSLVEFQNFAKAYPSSPFNKFAQDGMYELIMAGTNLVEYDEFIRAYPNYEKIEKLWKRFYQLYIEANGKFSVADFAKSYPNYPLQEELKIELQEAQNKKDLPLFEKATKDKDILLILNFIEKSPNSPFIAQMEEPMVEAIKKRPLFRACKKFLQLYPKSKYYNDVLEVFYDVYTQDGELITLQNFLMEYPEYANIDKQHKDLKIAEQGAKIRLEEDFDIDLIGVHEAYIKAAAPKERAFVALQHIIGYYIKEQKWDLALMEVNKFASYFGSNHPKIANLKEILSANTTAAQKTSIGEGVNTTLNEYVPLVSVNHKYLYFCRLDRANTGKEDENVYVSEFKDKKWQTAEYLQGINTHHNNEGPLAISADNQHIIIFDGHVGGGDMLISDHTSGGWTKPKSLPNSINTDAWEADAMISSDGKALLFVSEREEVIDLRLKNYPIGFHGRQTVVGNRDIFVSFKNEKGEWQTPINLGDMINTPFAERTPFLHPDMKTLYFSSEGHGGLGQLDVFKTTRLDDTWTNWTTPVNLGKAINTTKNDWGYRISTDGKTAYFSATGDKKNEDIFAIELPQEFRPNFVSTISGHLTDRAGNPIEAEIIWEDMETGNEVGRLRSNPKTGEFVIALPNDKEYSYFVFKEHYFPKSNHIDLRHKQGMVEVNEKLELVKIEEMVQHDIALPLKNLFFETGKHDIKKASYLELNRLVNLIQKYDLTISISGHTDNTGNAKDNLTLSQQRADAVKNYLVQNGCKAEKINAKGFGSEKPIADNKTEEGKRHNRRVEVRFAR